MIHRHQNFQLPLTVPLVQLTPNPLQPSSSGTNQIDMLRGWILGILSKEALKTRGAV